jgi:hypothetical protein
MATKQRTYEKVEAFDGLPFWQPEMSGDQIEGEISNLRDIKTRYGLQQVVDIGETHSVGLSAGLRKLSDLVGSYVRITYMGEAKNPNTGRMFKDYQIEKAV